MSEPVGGSLLRSGALPSDTADMPRPCSTLLSVCGVGVAASLRWALLAALLAGWEGASLLPHNNGSDAQSLVYANYVRLRQRSAVQS